MSSYLIFSYLILPSLISSSLFLSLSLARERQCNNAMSNAAGLRVSRALHPAMAVAAIVAKRIARGEKGKDQRQENVKFCSSLWERGKKRARTTYRLTHMLSCMCMCVCVCVCLAHKGGHRPARQMRPCLPSLKLGSVRHPAFSWLVLPSTSSGWAGVVFFLRVVDFFSACLSIAPLRLSSCCFFSYTRQVLHVPDKEDHVSFRSARLPGSG